MIFPATRLLRLLRVLRVIAIVRRLPTIAGLAKRRTARRSLALAAVVALSAITATAALLAFESGKNPELSSFPQAFWFSLYSIFATQPTPDVPLTLGGRVVSLILIFSTFTSSWVPTAVSNSFTSKLSDSKTGGNAPGTAPIRVFNVVLRLSGVYTKT